MILHVVLSVSVLAAVLDILYGGSQFCCPSAAADLEVSQ